MTRTTLILTVALGALAAPLAATVFLVGLTAYAVTGGQVRLSRLAGMALVGGLCVLARMAVASARTGGGDAA
jgi:hypothetical protein